MEKLYIIGNGFDIEHGLNTRYTDFRDYLSANEDKQLFLAQMLDAYGPNSKEWWNEFEKSLGEGDWFEAEFENAAICTINEMRTNDGETMPDIESALSIYWEDYYIFMEKLNQYVYDWIVDTVDLTAVGIKAKKIRKSPHFFINFNYTMVLEEIYGIKSSNILYIHGNVEEANVIMGHGQYGSIEEYTNRAKKAMERLDKNMTTVNDAIAKFYGITLKDTKRIIELNDYFWRRLKNVNKVEIYGHSLGDIDIPYFKKINSSIKSDSQWVFYIYNSDKREIQRKLESFGVNKEQISICSYEEFFR